MNLTKPQRGVALGMAVGIAATALALTVSPWLLPPATSLDVRLVFFVSGCLPLAATLAFAIARLAAHRFRTPEDINGSGLTVGSERARLLQATLQNTLEQLTLAVPVYAAWALLAPVRLAGTCAVAGILFLLGRVLFFAGYAGGAPRRALGFALTFYPTVTLLLGALAFALHRLGS